MKTTIAINKETLQNLNLMKYALEMDTIDETITQLILNYKTFTQLNKDLNKVGGENEQ